ncbi:MAG: TRAP transporter small permease [Pseudorhodoplanes sp.]|nr:TRAP transporter small permease [Pseudorhodoplanes sp.]MCL4710989.1 TRAP transporter small permease [Pseudorhodoplanes sp.]
MSIVAARPSGGRRCHMTAAHIMPRIISNLLARCDAVLIGAAVIATAIMMLLTSADAIGRYLFNSPIMGAYELTEKYLMVAAVFLGMSCAFREGIFIRVTFLVERLPRRARLISDFVSHLITIIYSAFIVYAAGAQALRALSDETTLSTVPVPLAPAYCLVPIGFAALLVMLLIDLPRVRTGNSLLFREEAPTA